MAGSRVEKIGTIFSRTTGLLRSGAVKYKDRPLWYDIYRMFPPKYEPYVERQPQITEIPEIFYEEDALRSKFFKRVGENPDPSKIRKLNDSTYEDPSQDFLGIYQEIKKANPESSEEDVFDLAIQKYSSSKPVTSFSKSESPYEKFPRKRRMITEKSLRSLFEEAKSDQMKTNKD